MAKKAAKKGKKQAKKSPKKLKVVKSKNVCEFC